VQMNLFHPAIVPESMDIVIADGVLHHTHDTKAAFKSIFRLVKPSGILSSACIIVLAVCGRISAERCTRLSVSRRYCLIRTYVMICRPPSGSLGSGTNICTLKKASI